MADVFISYCREDRSVAEHVAQDLESEGLSVFFDTRIPIGESWDVLLESELAAARAVVVLWSRAAQRSAWVRREARFGMRRGVLCPALIELCELPLEFSDVQCATLVGRPQGDRDGTEWRRLIAAIRACGATPSAIASPGEARAHAGVASIASPGGALPHWALEGHTDTIWKAKFAADGSRIITASADGTARVWEGHGPGLIAVLEGHDENVHDATLSPDGNRALTCAGFVAKYWDIARAMPTTRLGAHTSYVRSVEFSPDGLCLLTSSWDGTARIWGLSGNAVGGPFTHVGNPHEGSFFASQFDHAVFSAGGRQVITHTHGVTKVWRADTGELVSTVVGNVTALSRDAKLALVGSRTLEDHDCEIWDVQRGVCLQTLKGHNDWVTGADFSPDSSLVVTTSRDYTARIWDVSSGACARALVHTLWANNPRFMPNGLHLLTGGFEGDIRLWNVADGWLLHTLKGHRDCILHIDVSPSGDRIASASRQDAFVWRV